MQALAKYDKLRFMRKKSDYRGERRISATEASRSFSRLLDEVESGRRFVVHRRGRDVCAITSPPVDARRASECLALLHTRSPVKLDDTFSADLLEVLEEEVVEERPFWDS
ncbi:MAG: type II toxin-antitoxin system Phd/YefM family antitoxin [Gemmatimonadota bacterium]|nr:type II toxin-antitoxin system Phd/YefM family antitoxin [Gemmatimonadota bacterium]